MTSEAQVASYRRVLGLDAGASPETVRRNHRELIRRSHPDVGGSEETAKLLNEARDYLLRHPDRIAKATSPRPEPARPATPATPTWAVGHPRRSGVGYSPPVSASGATGSDGPQGLGAVERGLQLLGLLLALGLGAIVLAATGWLASALMPVARLLLAGF